MSEGLKGADRVRPNPGSHMLMTGTLWATLQPKRRWWHLRAPKVQTVCIGTYHVIGHLATLQLINPPLSVQCDVSQVSGLPTPR